MVDWSDTSPAELLESHLSRPPNTSRVYAADLDSFALYLELGSREEAVEELLGRSRGAAQRMMHDYVSWLRDEYAALNTIRRKAQAIMGLVRLAHETGVIEWMLKPLRLPAAEPVRDMQGPERDQVMKMLELCRRRADRKGARDEALITLMAFAALRCDETLSLDVRHVSLERAEVHVLGKGRWGRERHPIPMRAAEAVGRWLGFRGEDAGPLFTTLNHRNAADGDRLSYRGAYESVRQIGTAVGVRCSPHRLRHFAATEVLRLTGGNVTMAAALTRHRNLSTLVHYDDARRRSARGAAELIAAGMPNYRRYATGAENV